MKSEMTILVGYPGAGKSTFAAKLASNTNAVIVSEDALSAMMPNAPNLRDIVANYLTDKALEFGLDVIIDATNLTKPDRGRWSEIGRRRGASIHVVFMDTPFGMCRANRPEMSDDLFLRMSEKFEGVSDDEDYDTLTIAVRP